MKVNRCLTFKDVGVNDDATLRLQHFFYLIIGQYFFFFVAYQQRQFFGEYNNIIIIGMVTYFS